MLESIAEFHFWVTKEWYFHRSALFWYSPAEEQFSGRFKQIYNCEAICSKSEWSPELFFPMKQFHSAFSILWVLFCSFDVNTAVFISCKMDKCPWDGSHSHSGTLSTNNIRTFFTVIPFSWFSSQNLQNIQINRNKIHFEKTIGLCSLIQNCYLCWIVFAYLRVATSKFLVVRLRLLSLTSRP